MFASVVDVEPTRLALTPGLEFCPLWGADHPLRFPDDGSKPPYTGYFPPLGGFRFGMFTLAPDSVAFRDGFDMEAAMGELDEKLPGLADFLEPDNPGMHISATVDYEYIVSGRCVLDLDDGRALELGPGDTVIQNGTRHAWRNPYDEPCVIVFALVGAHHEAVSHD
jgi:mannose-6-phosphate isomerase-like protein (cupin superfamily)